MFGHSFYFGSIRKYIILFGTLFNDIMIERVDQNTGDVLKRIKVPLSYGPKDRYLVRLKENPDLLRQINQILPRMAFEIKSVTYDADRKLNTVGRNKFVIENEGNSIKAQYNPVPYNLDIQLSVLARNADDATRIIEQILPFFKPEWTTTINLIPEMGIKMDIPVVLKSVRYEDTYEGSFTDRYAIVWDLEFTLKGYFYGPISEPGIIKEVDVNFYNMTTSQKIEEIIITPGLTANGEPTSNAALSIPQDDIQANSNYGYIVDFITNVEDL